MINCDSGEGRGKRVRKSVCNGSATIIHNTTHTYSKLPHFALTLH